MLHQILVWTFYAMSVVGIVAVVVIVVCLAVFYRDDPDTAASLYKRDNDDLW